MPRTKKMWERTNDIVGHKRNFTHKCSSCGNDKMVLRHSSAIPYTQHKIPTTGRYIVEDPCNIMSYKCTKCGLVDRFVIDDTREYINKILRLREGVTLYVPPKEEWAAENKEIKERLESLGYF